MREALVLAFFVLTSLNAQNFTEPNSTKDSSIEEPPTFFDDPILEQKTTKKPIKSPPITTKRAGNQTKQNVIHQQPQTVEKGFSDLEMILVIFSGMFAMIIIALTVALIVILRKNRALEDKTATKSAVEQAIQSKAPPNIQIRRISTNRPIVYGPANKKTESTKSFEDEVQPSSELVNRALVHHDTWAFDVLQLEKVNPGNVLASLGVKIFGDRELHNALGCSRNDLYHWLCLIEAHYHRSNTFHNSSHAADVLQATSYFLDASTVPQTMSPAHQVAALLAAVIHDIDHPGRTASFLVARGHSLALVYNDRSVLENHHAALGFSLIVKENGVNILRNMSLERFCELREAIIDLVLATDLTYRSEYVNEFCTVFDTNSGSGTANDLSVAMARMVVKCADISNPIRSWPLCQRWAFRFVEELFQQTEEELENRVQPVKPMFNRISCNIPAIQCDFIDRYVRPAFSPFSQVTSLGHLMSQLESNYHRWKEMQGTWTPEKNRRLET